MQSLDELTQLFNAQRQSSRVHHAWIIEGIDESAIEPWLDDVITQLVARKIGENHFHPNLFWIAESDSHTVDAARLVISFLEKTSWDGGWKVCVIMGANQLNAQAQNALLKVMEEPPEKSVIFLISERTHTLLPTIYSRGLHVILSAEASNNQLELQTFMNDWMTAVITILERQDFEPLLTLQARLTENTLDAETQGKWTLLALKQIIDGQGRIAEPSETIDRLLTVAPTYDWVQRWMIGQAYLSKALEFKVDEKQFCVKLTTKILE
ncbi:hypothetical protein [Candidatus Bodocaedibacter vickermanii]|uniref:DNA polymerase III subunit delta n=1 Tax=Candidatus Bodocaedibacter vickermanii TaxID=2741701 RepID=A0A7L9RRZ4_9PROT|nr:DNA polymerase III subunit delta' [Candidatus Paracaedibacteraceae bacterium 'Lake Konstanz']